MNDKEFEKILIEIDNNIKEILKIQENNANQSKNLRKNVENLSDIARKLADKTEGYYKLVIRHENLINILYDYIFLKANNGDEQAEEIIKKFGIIKNESKNENKEMQNS